VGTDVILDPEDIESSFAPGRNFANKLWNAGRFILANLDGPVRPLAGPHAGAIRREELALADRWIIARCDATVREVTEALERFRLNEAAAAAYRFVWSDLADWYIEQIKPRLTGDQPGGDVARAVAAQTFDVALRLLHPVMPFITEELWQAVAPRAGKAAASIMREPYPSSEATLVDEEAEALTRQARDITISLRGIRGSFDIAPSVRTPIFIRNASAQDRQRIESSAPAICRLAGVSEIRWLAAGQEAPQSAAASVGSLVVYLPMAGLIDVDAELARLDKRRSKVGQELARAEAKLGNENFVRNAPAEVVAQEQARVLEFKRELAQLAEQYERVASLR
jgi:valyl-tRNA synthetase